MSDLMRWPPLLRSTAVAFNPRGQTLGGPVSLTGQSQVNSIDAGYWMANVDLRILELGDDVNAYRGLRAEMEGGGHHVLVPAFDQGQAPWPLSGGWQVNEKEAQTWSDDTTWSDGTGWYHPAIRVYLAEDASLRATSIVVDIEASGTIKAGQYFSIHGAGLHVVRRVLDSDGTERTLAIWPPLRWPVSTGRRCNFERPVCRMRLLSESDADLVLGLLWLGTPTMAFIEVFQ